MKEKEIANICFDCQRACGGCSWSEIDPKTEKVRFEPVPGWTAEPVMLNVSKRELLASYHITDCPLFLRDKKRKNAVHYYGGE